MSADPNKMFDDLMAEYAGKVHLSPAEERSVRIAADFLARANSMDSLVKREGQMIEGGNRRDVMVLHPGIAEARTCRKEAATILSRIKVEGNAPKKLQFGSAASDNARHAAVARHQKGARNG
ncbi:hypothetical protein [Streptomyces sp. NPDC056132]|uniref:hypothetical protein n=1 Tax=Streptomyces sp. NPDC056132 TaxID=3345722 RepID=UPI0035E138B1